MTTKKTSEVFHAPTYSGRKEVVPSDTDKAHRCPSCWSVLYSSADADAVLLPVEEYRECWHCGTLVGPVDEG